IFAGLLLTRKVATHVSSSRCQPWRTRAVRLRNRTINGHVLGWWIIVIYASTFRTTKTETSRAVTLVALQVVIARRLTGHTVVRATVEDTRFRIFYSGTKGIPVGIRHRYARSISELSP